MAKLESSRARITSNRAFSPRLLNAYNVRLKSFHRCPNLEPRMDHPSKDALRYLLSNEHFRNADLVEHIESCGDLQASIEEILNESLCSPSSRFYSVTKTMLLRIGLKEKDRFLLGEEIGRGGMELSTQLRI